jgi:hypothetical protein
MLMQRVVYHLLHMSRNRVPLGPLLLPLLIHHLAGHIHLTLEVARHLLESPVRKHHRT